MQKRLSCLFLVLLAACVSQPVVSEPFDVLILGDSISMGYTPHVQTALGDRARVVRPTRTREDGTSVAENCAGTNNGIQHLERWLAADGEGWDVIHFNFGLHDLKRVHPTTGKNSNDPSHPHQAGPERYRRQLHDISTRLQATGARLIFATTTPVPPGDLRPYRAPADAILYNRIAEEVMDSLGIPVNDLHTAVLSEIPHLMKHGNVHFPPEGSRWLGERVANVILERAGLAPR